MRIVFDARYVRTDFHDGVSRYSVGVGTALSEIADVCFMVSSAEQMKWFPVDAEYVIGPNPESIRELFASFAVNKFKPDVVVSPLQTFGSIGRKFHLVLTIHDTIYYRHRRPPTQARGFMKRAGWIVYHLSYLPERLVLRGADLVATVSQTTKQDISSLRLTKRPVVVVPNAPSDSFNAVKDLSVSSAAPDKLVYIGSFMPYKNVETLVRAMSLIPGRTLHLVSKISADRQRQLEELISERGRLVFHNGLSDAEVRSLLLDRSVLVSATLDEGFCLPLVEATELRVPIAVSDLPVTREVLGRGAEYFDPHDPRGLADAVHRIDDELYRHKLVESAVAHVSQFSWSESARVLLERIERLFVAQGDARGETRENTQATALP